MDSLPLIPPGRWTSTFWMFCRCSFRLLFKCCPLRSALKYSKSQVKKGLVHCETTLKREKHAFISEIWWQKQISTKQRTACFVTLSSSSLWSTLKMIFSGFEDKEITKRMVQKYFSLHTSSVSPVSFLLPLWINHLPVNRSELQLVTEKSASGESTQPEEIWIQNLVPPGHLWCYNPIHMSAPPVTAHKHKKQEINKV